MNPEMNITKKAGPSAESANENSRPQCSQRGRRARNPAKSLPLPQRGQRPDSPVTIGDGDISEETVTRNPLMRRVGKGADTNSDLNKRLCAAPCPRAGKEGGPGRIRVGTARVQATDI